MPFPKEVPHIPLAVIAETMRSWSIEVMFTCILRFRSVREEAVIVLKRGYFNHAGEDYLSYLFELIQRPHPAHNDREKISLPDPGQRRLGGDDPPRVPCGPACRGRAREAGGDGLLHHPYVRPTGSWGLIYRSYHELTDDVTR
jgi:hypothetical protein